MNSEEGEGNFNIKNSEPRNSCRHGKCELWVSVFCILSGFHPMSRRKSELQVRTFTPEFFLPLTQN